MRLAAQAKGGFYPTPDKVVDMIATLIDTPRLSYYSRGKTVRILDPCCGAGEAVAQLAECLGRPNTLPIETFGVELHKDRAEEAKVMARPRPGLRPLPNLDGQRVLRSPLPQPAL